MKYKILAKGPVRGKRIRLCRTDEALISRISANSRYDGMVERLQPLKETKNGIITFNYVFLRYREEYRTLPMHIDYHLSKFLALKLAQIHFPENIVNIHELRFFQRKGMVYAATYSDFVPDESGIIERRKQAMQKYYETKNLDIITETDKEEERLNPDLRKIVKGLALLGIMPAHPQANYHIHNGNTVLFEIDRIDLTRALYYTNRIKDPEKRKEAIKLVVIMCACFSREWASWELNYPRYAQNRIKEMGFQRLVSIFESLILFKMSKARGMEIDFLEEAGELRSHLDIDLLEHCLEIPTINPVPDVDVIYNKFRNINL